MQWFGAHGEVALSLTEQAETGLDRRHGDGDLALIKQGDAGLDLNIAACTQFWSANIAFEVLTHLISSFNKSICFSSSKANSALGSSEASFVSVVLSL